MMYHAFIGCLMICLLAPLAGCDNLNLRPRSQLSSPPARAKNKVRLSPDNCGKEPWVMSNMVVPVSKRHYWHPDGQPCQIRMVRS